MDSNTSSLILQQIGVSKPAALIYLTLLHKGALGAAQISKNTKLGRTYVYALLAELEARGLITSNVERGRKKFYAQHPEALWKLVAEREHDIQFAKETLKQNWSDLLKNFGFAYMNRGAYHFDGMQGVQRVYDDLLADGLTLQSIQDRSLLRQKIGNYNKSFVAKRVRKVLRHRIIDCGDKVIDSADQGDLREVHQLKHLKKPWSIDLKINSKKVVITTFASPEPSGFVILDDNIATNFLALFERLWESTE